jgi:hypothetical protein
MKRDTKEKYRDNDGNTIHSKYFQISSIQGIKDAEKYKAKHENAGATVTTLINSLGDIVLIKAVYQTN